MPPAVVGGVSVILYGMISGVGVRNLIENHVDFQKTRNVIIAAVVLVLSIGIAYSTVGAVVISAPDVTISLSGLAVGALAGIVLNIILPGKPSNDEDEDDAAEAGNMTLEGPFPYDPSIDPYAK